MLTLSEPLEVILTELVEGVQRLLARFTSSQSALTLSVGSETTWSVPPPQETLPAMPSCALIQSLPEPVLVLSTSLRTRSPSPFSPSLGTPSMVTLTGLVRPLYKAVSLPGPP